MDTSKLIWSSLGTSQFILAAVGYSYVYDPNRAPILQMEQSHVFIGASILAFHIALAGHFAFRKSKTLDEQARVPLQIVSWALAETITVLGVAGLIVGWNKIEYSYSLWAVGIVLWFLRKPTAA